jgi:hypothetical protein
VGGQSFVTEIEGVVQIVQVAVLVAENVGLPKTPEATPEATTVSVNGPQRLLVGW